MSNTFEAVLEAQQRSSKVTAREGTEPWRKAWITIADRTTQQKKMQDVPAAAKEERSSGLFKPRPLAATILALLFLLVAAVEAYVWVGPIAVAAGLNKLTQRNTAEPERVLVRRRIENGALRQAHDVVKPEAAHAWDVLQALRWNVPVMLRGAIAHGLNRAMQLVREGSKLWGSSAYQRIGKDIPARGIMEETGSLALEEFAKGPKTGIFTGNVVSDTGIEGKWSNPGGNTRSLDFFLVSTSLPKGTPVSHDQGRTAQQQVEYTLCKILDQSLLSGNFGPIQPDLPKNQPAP